MNALVTMFFVFLSAACFAQTPVPQVPVAATPPPIAVSVSAPTTSSQVAVAEPAALPQWAQEILVVAEKLPVVGPLVSKILLYAGIFAVLLTSLVAFLSGLLATLSGVFNFTGLTKASAALADFKNGKIMYWITYFSNFNAQKPASPTAGIVLKS